MCVVYLSPAPGAGALAGHVRVTSRSAAGDCLLSLLLVCCDGRRDRLVKLLALSVLRGGRVPVVHDLQEENKVERKASNEAVEDEWVVDFLEGGEDARGGTEEVVDDLGGLLVATTVDV